MTHIRPGPHTVGDVMAVVAHAFGVTAADLRSHAQPKRRAVARCTLAAVLCSRGMSRAEAGRRLGRHHTTVMYDVKRFFESKRRESAVAQQVWDALCPPGMEHCASAEQLKDMVAARAGRW
jgi:chromosomal replication initiation ATPase DnaA